MSNYNLAKIKVKLWDDAPIFDAYELRDENGKRVEWNSGGYTHPHFDKKTALQVTNYYNEFFSYDNETDTFTETEDGEFIDSVTCNRYGLYEIGCDWAWVNIEN